MRIQVARKCMSSWCRFLRTVLIGLDVTCVSFGETYLRLCQVDVIEACARARVYDTTI